MDSDNLQGQPQNTFNVSTTRNKSVQNCKICHQQSAEDNMVKDSNCHLPYHYECVKVTNSKIPWYCINCSIELPPMSLFAVNLVKHRTPLELQTEKRS